MSYLSLFTGFMLVLVTADNFVVMFFGWEGIGLASFLLISFWFRSLLMLIILYFKDKKKLLLLTFRKNFQN
jgi:NADH:ubiquinone oxidoreductase subunit 5 (subunit L)/multisubunit Na+/H+ antiporter MnhA subunit